MYVIVCITWFFVFAKLQLKKFSILPLIQVRECDGLSHGKDTAGNPICHGVVFVEWTCAGSYIAGSGARVCGIIFHLCHLLAV